MPDYSYLNLSVAALYLETLAINKGRETASSQRFSYFGSLAEGNGGDGACMENRNRAVSFPLPDSFWSAEDAAWMPCCCRWREQRIPLRTWCRSAVQLSKWGTLTEGIRWGLTAVPLNHYHRHLRPFAVWTPSCVRLVLCCWNVFCIQTEYIKL